MNKPTRFIIEGFWRGYRSNQDRVVHLSVHSASEKKLRAWADKNYCITFTDGTALVLNVRDCKPRERVTPKHGYLSLIRDCAAEDVNAVEALATVKEARAKARRQEIEAAKSRETLTIQAPLHVPTSMEGTGNLPEAYANGPLPGVLKE